MKKIDETVKRETLYIALWTFVMSLLMQAVFLVLRRWDLTVLFGNLLSYTVGVFNFFLMGLTIQSALGKEEKDAKTQMKLSQSLRLLMILVFAALGAALPIFNIWATLIPFFFPRIAVMLRPFLGKKDPEIMPENDPENQ